MVVIGLLVIIAAAVFLEVRTETVLIVTDREHQRRGTIGLPEQTFTLTYIHSVHLTPVDEVYTVDADQNLMLTETRFSSLGVGMPYTDEGGEFSASGGQFRLTGLSRTSQTLSLLVSDIPQHSIRVGEKNYPLLEFTGPGGALTLQAGQRRRLVWRRDGTEVGE